MKKNNLLKLVFAGMLISLPVFVFAANPTTININPNLPGFTTPSDPNQAVGGWVSSFYTFALLLSGVLAFGAIVYGGVKYAMAAGNPSSQGDAKGWITGALLGLLLLAGAYIVLQTINPDILNLTLPGLPGLTIGSSPPPTSGGGVIAPPSVGCQLGQCAQITGPGLACKPPPAVPSCTADALEVALLQCIQQKSGQSLLITEAYPPTVFHIEKCHSDGCCVDLQPANGGPNASCADVQSIINAAQACGAPEALNEFTNCNGSVNPGSRTGNNIHVRACN